MIFRSKASIVSTKNEDTMAVKNTSEQLVQNIKELQENTDFVITLLESLVEYAIMAADFNGNIIAYSEGARRVYGYAPEEVVGKQNIKIFFPRDFIEAGKLQHIMEELKENGAFSYEGEKVRDDGKRFPAQIMFTVIKDGSGKLVGFIEIVEDLTERKRTHQQLYDNLANFQKVVANNADGIIIIDSEGAVSLVNPAAELLFSRRADDLIGKEFGFPTVSGETTEINIIRGDGKTAVVEMRVVETEWKGETAYVASLRDITERKRVEEAMREVDRMKSEFLCNVSHELRTPLQSIQGFTKLMLQGKVPEPQKQQEFLTIMDNESQRLGTLISSLLDMSRLESGRFVIQKKLLPIRDVILDAVASIRSLASEKDIAIEEDIPTSLPEIEADGERLRQVMVNLLNNAIKFSNAGSNVTVKAEVKDRKLMVQVTDHGIGITDEAMPYLFERFYRAEDSMARGGAGLGLYISKEIVEAHGGRIWAESKSGEGSTFIFTLPLDEIVDDSQYKNILVIDDDPSTSRFISYTLEQEGYRVSTSPNGLEGLRKAQNEGPDLIVLDIMLPGIDGFEICQRLRAEPETAKLPILMLSAKAHEVDKATGLRVGADDYLTKPVDPAEIVKGVENLLAQAE